MVERYIKTFSDESHASNFVEGNLIFKSLNYYRMWENERGDKNEGSFWHKGINGIPTNTSITENIVLILSLWTSSNSGNVGDNKFGSFHVEVLSPCDLINELKNKIKLESNFYFGRVNYTHNDPCNNLEGTEEYFKKYPLKEVQAIEFLDREVYVSNNKDIQCPFIEVAFTKDIKYSCEKEVRIAFLFKNSLPLKTDNYEIKLMKKEIEHKFSDSCYCCIEKVCNFLILIIGIQIRVIPVEILAK